MAIEANSGVSLRMQADPRLAAAAGGVARYFADAAGMDAHAIAELQEATVMACKLAFAHLSVQNPLLIVDVRQYADRIEVAVKHRGEDGTATNLDGVAGSAALPSGESQRPGTFGGVDRVQYEAQGGESVTRLTKYIGQVAPNV